MVVLELWKQRGGKMGRIDISFMWTTCMYEIPYFLSTSTYTIPVLILYCIQY